MAHQRHLYRRGILPEQRFRALAAAGLHFDAHDAAWQRRFAQLAAFHSAAGHAAPRRADPRTPPGLYDWVCEQRAARRAGLLSDERGRRLQGLGFAWDAWDAHWSSRLAELRAFAARHGHCRVPGGQPGLGAWARRQRALARQRRLPRAREQALRELGFFVGEGEAGDSGGSGGCQRRPPGARASIAELAAQAAAAKQPA